MNPWLPLAGALAYNVRRHMQGKSTICSTTRRLLPKTVAVAGLFVGFEALLVHYLNGYPIAINLDLTPER